MKRLMAITVIILFSEKGTAENKKMDIEKIINENSIVVKGLKKLGFDTMGTGKKMLKEISEPERKKSWNEPERSKIWVEGKSLKECMGNGKVLNNNTIQCHNGYFKESD